MRIFNLVISISAVMANPTQQAQADLRRIQRMLKNAVESGPPLDYNLTQDIEQWINTAREALTGKLGQCWNILG